MTELIVLHHRFDDLFVMLPSSVTKIIRGHHHKHDGPKKGMSDPNRLCMLSVECIYNIKEEEGKRKRGIEEAQHVRQLVEIINVTE